MYNDILYFNFFLLGLIVLFFLFYLWLCRVGTTSTLHLLLIKKFYYYLLLRIIKIKTIIIILININIRLKIIIIIITICNISLPEDQWLQASLPVRFGGLGIHHESSLAIPSFRALAVSTRIFLDHIHQLNTSTCFLLAVTLTDVVSCSMNIMVKFNYSHHLLSSKHGTNRFWNANCCNSWNARLKTMTW